MGSSSLAHSEEYVLEQVELGAFRAYFFTGSLIYIWRIKLREKYAWNEHRFNRQFIRQRWEYSPMELKHVGINLSATFSANSNL
jgi:hypothetical protein